MIQKCACLKTGHNCALIAMTIATYIAELTRPIRIKTTVRALGARPQAIIPVLMKLVASVSADAAASSTAPPRRDGPRPARPYQATQTKNRTACASGGAGANP